MTELAAAEGVYKLDGIKGNYQYVIFTDNSGKQYPAQNAEWQAIGDNNYFYVNSGSLQCGTYTEKGEEVWIPREAAGYAGYNLTYTVNNESRTAVSGIFTLKAGEKAVFTGIPLGNKVQDQRNIVGRIFFKRSGDKQYGNTAGRGSLLLWRA